MLFLKSKFVQVIRRGTVIYYINFHLMCEIWVFKKVTFEISYKCKIRAFQKSSNSHFIYQIKWDAHGNSHLSEAKRGRSTHLWARCLFHYAFLKGVLAFSLTCPIGNLFNNHDKLFWNAALFLHIILSWLRHRKSISVAISFFIFLKLGMTEVLLGM